MNKQISKWFVNNTHYEDKEVGNGSKRTKISTSTTDTSLETDDTDAQTEHTKELKKELTKSKYDHGKLVRLLSLTSKARVKDRNNEKCSTTRFLSTFKKYPCFRSPFFVSNLLTI